jgi:hypothetical protein
MHIIANNLVTMLFILGVFTSDRLHGLIALPKRPWEKFKDSENTMKRIASKHNKDNIRY